MESITKVASDAEVKPVHAAGAVAGGDIRPPLDYSSARAFASSFQKRFISLWTRRFCLSLLAGQVSRISTSDITLLMRLSGRFIVYNVHKCNHDGTR